MPHGVYTRTKKHRDQLSRRSKALWQDPHSRKIMLDAILSHCFKKGHVVSIQTGGRISNALMGHSHSKLTKKKQSQAKLKNPTRYWLGKHLSQTHKRNIGEGGKGKHVHSKELIKQILTRRLPTSLERKFQSIIDNLGLPYCYVGDGSFVLGNYNPDFINTNGSKIAVEVFATYFKKRNNVSIKRWKSERTKVFKQYGWNLIYFDETQVNEEYISRVLSGGD